MKKFLPLLAAILLTVSFSCKKAIENKEQQLLLQAITDGQWFVTQYIQDSVDITSSFDGYLFQFYSNGKVIGYVATDTTSGTWSGDVANSTITSQFPSAGDPIKKLNGLWKLTTTYSNYVEAEMDIAPGNKNILHLQKQ